MLHTQVAVIGAGMAGLATANALKKKGIAVEVFEKARGSGGRLSSKAIQLNENERVTFDLGCTHFSATHKSFSGFLQPFVDANKAAHWPAEEQFIGLSRNSALTRAIADELSVHFSTRITKLDRASDGKWQLWQGLSQQTQQNSRDESSNEKVLVKADHVVLAIPPEQAKALLATTESQGAQALFVDLNAMGNAYLAPQWVMGLVLKGEVQFENADGFSQVWQPVSDAIDQVTLESAKPARSPHPVLQIQATITWTQQRLDWSKEEVAAELIYVLKSLMPEMLGLDGDYQTLHVHRWLYSSPQPQTVSTGAYLSDPSGLHLCGDYFLAKGKQDGVESAFLSGSQLAEYIGSTVF